MSPRVGSSLELYSSILIGGGTTIGAIESPIIAFESPIVASIRSAKSGGIYEDRSGGLR